MTLYDLKKSDIADLHALISARSLTITADNAKRVAQLQTLLEQAQPSTALEECKVRCEALEKEVQECLRKRDHALLEQGLAQGREAKLRSEVSETIAALEANELGECSECHSLLSALKQATA